jgi:hypothetical protein
MPVPEHMTIMDGVSRYRPEGVVTLVEGVELVTDAISHCFDEGIRKLLVDVRRLRGHAVPTLVDRFLMARDWAHAARGAVAVALVALPEHIHPEKFGVKVANDAGMTADVFTSDTAAEEWLRTIDPARPGPGAAA